MQLHAGIQAPLRACRAETQRVEAQHTDIRFLQLVAQGHPVEDPGNPGGYR